jgi:hypothetical protein
MPENVSLYASTLAMLPITHRSGYVEIVRCAGGRIQSGLFTTTPDASRLPLLIRGGEGRRPGVVLNN